MTPSSASPPAADPVWLLRELTSARVLTPERAEQVGRDFGEAGVGSDAAGLADFLVLAGLLTPYQADRALAGQAATLVLGPYLLREPVGTGSLGSVFRAVSRVDRGRYAVKVLPLRSMWNVIRAKNQVDVFTGLPEHQAVVPFVDIGTAAGSHYLAWPFVEGESFELLVRRTGPLSPAHVVRFLAPVADGLALCHKHDIVHGLFKPSNVLLGPDRRAHILDFGIGAILSDNIAEDESLLDTISTASTAMGMMDCAAPETVADPTTVRTAAGDLYSFGCTLYYLLTGSYPFPDGNAVDKIIAHQTLEPVPVRERNPQVPAALAELVEHLMKKNPAARPADAGWVAAALFRAVPAAGRATADLPAPRIDSARGSGRAGVPVPRVAEGGVGAALNRGAHEQEGSAECVSFGISDSDHDGVGGTRPSGPPARAAGSGSSFRPVPVRPAAPVPADTPPRAVETPRPTPLRPLVPVRDLPPLAPPTPVPAPAAEQERSTLEFRPRGDVLPPVPMNWAQPPNEVDLSQPEVVVPDAPRFATESLWRAVRRVCFWVAARDTIQFSLFGPTGLSPGQTSRLQVYAHAPAAFRSVRTLSRAFRSDTELLATGYANRLVPRGQEVGLHLAIANAGVAKSLVQFPWLGQPRPWTFEAYVPWESPAGRTPAVLTVGLNNIQVARFAFEVVIMTRSG